MKNYLGTICFLLVGMVFCNAQNYAVATYIGDDGDYWSGGYPYEILTLNSTLSAERTLPFAFDFYGQAVTTYRISPSGYIVFDAPSTAAVTNNTSLPTIAGPNKAIYAIWDNFASSWNASIRTYGTSPNRVHQISWTSLRYPGSIDWQDNITVSINLYERCQDFEVVIVDNSILPTSTFYSAISTTIGCENATGTLGTQVAGSPNYIPSDPGWLNAKYEVHRFTWNDPVVHDASLVGLAIDNHLTVGNHSLKGVVRNEGDAPLTAYAVNYSLNGGAVQTSVVNSTAANNGDKTTWTHTTPINMPTTNTTYKLKVWVNAINGQTDDRNCNDTLVEYLTGINHNSSPRKVLLEEFTGAWCGHCADGAVFVDDLETQYGRDFIPVAVHDGDSMEFVDGLRTAFSVTSYPSAVVDRINSTSAAAYTREPIGRGSWPLQVSNQLTAFTPVDVTINQAWDPNTRSITANVMANYSDHSAGDARIVLMVVEDSVVGAGRGWDQANYYDNTTGHPYFGMGSPIVGFVHRHVLRDYVNSGPFGVEGIIPSFVTAGSTYQQSFQYTLPAQYNADQVSLVAAVVKYLPGNDPMYAGVRGQRIVYNATEAKLTRLTNTVRLEQAFSDVLVHPNPTNNQVTLTIKNYIGTPLVKVYNTAGQLLQTTAAHQIDLQAYPSGVYLFQVHYANQVRSIKVIKTEG